MNSVRKTRPRLTYLLFFAVAFVAFASAMSLPAAAQNATGDPASGAALTQGKDTKTDGRQADAADSAAASRNGGDALATAAPDDQTADNKTIVAAATSPSSNSKPAVDVSANPRDRCDLISGLLTCLDDVAHDQWGMWTSPVHLRKKDALWLLPVAGATAAAFATDNKVPAALGGSKTLSVASGDVSQFGTGYALGGAAAAIWAVGKISHNERVRETGMVSLEALADAGIVANVLKLGLDRFRPDSGSISGKFWPDNPAKPGLDSDEYTTGGSFPSGHTMATWAVMHVLVEETPGHRWWHIGFYGIATAVSIARVTGERHFPSDVIVGGTLGYLIGGYVYHQRSQFYHQGVKLVSVVPIYDGATRTYGMSVSVAP